MLSQIYWVLQKIGLKYSLEIKQDLTCSLEQFVEIAECIMNRRMEKIKKVQKKVEDISRVLENYESINQFIQIQQSKQSEFEPMIRNSSEKIAELDQKREKLEVENDKKALLLDEEEKSVKLERALHYKQKEEIENQQKMARQKLNIANIELGKVTKNDLYELRMNMNNSNTNQLVKFTLECVAIIIEES